MSPAGDGKKNGRREAEWAPRGLDTTKAHPARRYNYWLGGKDHFAVDRESAEVVAASFPTVRLAAIENRVFLRRAVTYLTETAGIRQYLDIGAGLPSAGNVHEVAQAIAPESRVVYVDNDPSVLVHARALLTSHPQGRTAYLEADLRDPDKILGDPELEETLDLSRPVALMLVATMHFVEDQYKPYDLVKRLRSVLAPGSHLVMTNATGDYLTQEERDASAAANARSGVPFRPRTREEFAAFFDDLDLVPPGVCSVLEWRPEGTPEHTVEEISMHCAVARIP